MLVFGEWDRRLHFGCLICQSLGRNNVFVTEVIAASEVALLDISPLYQFMTWYLKLQRESFSGHNSPIPTIGQQRKCKYQYHSEEAEILDEKVAYLTLCLQCPGIIINAESKCKTVSRIGKTPGSLSVKNKSETGSSSSRVTLVVKLLRFLTVIRSSYHVHNIMLT